MQVGVDRGDQVGHRLKDAAADRLVGELAEEPLDHVHPRAGRRREVQMKAWVLGQPRLDVLMLVRCVVVEDQVDLQALGDLAIDRAQELQKLDVAMTCLLYTSTSPRDS